MGYYVTEPKYDEILEDDIDGRWIHGHRIHSESKKHLIFWIKNILHGEMKSLEDMIYSHKNKLDRYMVMLSNLNVQARAHTDKEVQNVDA